MVTILISLNVMCVAIVLFFFDWSRLPILEGGLLNIWVCIPLIISYILIKVYKSERKISFRKIKSYTAWVLSFSYFFILFGTIIYPLIIKSSLMNDQQVIIIYLLLPAVLIFQGCIGSIVGFFVCHLYKHK